MKNPGRIVPRLLFSDEEHIEPSLKTPIRKAEQAADKLERINQRIIKLPQGTHGIRPPGYIAGPIKSVSSSVHGTTADKQSKPPDPKLVAQKPFNRNPLRIERTVDLATAKSTVRLRFEEIQKPRPPSKMNHVVSSLSNAPVQQAHHQIARSEKENVGVEAGHKSEEAAEAGLRTTRNVQRSRKFKPYRQAARAERKLDGANLRYIRQKTTQSQPPFSANPVSRWQQKQAIRKEYMAIKAGKSTGSVSAAAANTRSALKQGGILLGLRVLCPDMRPMHQKKQSHFC